LQGICGCRRVLDAVQDLLGPLRVDLSRFGERQVSRAAIDQLHAESLFEAGDMARHGRGRQ